jgi:rod shape-determining protein MreB
MEVRGANLSKEFQRHHYLRRGNPRGAVDAISTIINAVRVALERTPPELSADMSSAESF